MPGSVADPVVAVLRRTAASPAERGSGEGAREAKQQGDSDENKMLDGHDGARWQAQDEA
jgi:hypothetical protein